MTSHDGIVHHPLGAGSYYFKTSLIRYLNDQCDHSPIVIHIGYQPNCSPHIGNIVTFAVGFAIAAAIKADFNRDVRVKFVLVDTAPSPTETTIIEGVKYQRSLQHTGAVKENIKPLTQILARLSELAEIPFDLETQDIWRSNPRFLPTLQKIISRRDILGPHLSPETGKLAIRAPCPDCGLADKHALNNQYHDNESIQLRCHIHGKYTIDLTLQSDLNRLEFNTPLRNLIRILLCSADRSHSWIMVTGSDYAGFYQDQLLWKHIEHRDSAPVIFYAPLILDWSGVKLSKSLYVKDGAYQYLVDAGQGYLLNGEKFHRIEGAMEALFEEVSEWVEKPFMLFRSYSVEYLDGRLRERGMRV
ncbi:hypothetical protein BJY04DRAFT_198991 [Aspergillus karnatakaensis]|uniref:uncharacterized protein n=1 Tax=Aspergillus karnatakaensis TaxID=1810916 RepID=UPI003CCD8BAE